MSWLLHKLQFLVGGHCRIEMYWYSEHKLSKSRPHYLFKSFVKLRKKKKKSWNFLQQILAVWDGGVGHGDVCHVFREYRVSHICSVVLGGVGPWICQEHCHSLTPSWPECWDNFWSQLVVGKFLLSRSSFFLQLLFSLVVSYQEMFGKITDAASHNYYIFFNQWLALKCQKNHNKFDTNWHIYICLSQMKLTHSPR